MVLEEAPERVVPLHEFPELFDLKGLNDSL